jgi:hypothetical protein
VVCDFWKKKSGAWEILDSYGNDYEEHRLLGYEAVIDVSEEPAPAIFRAKKCSHQIPPEWK